MGRRRTCAPSARHDTQQELSKIVITAPTGTIGRQVLDTVLKSNQPIRVIVRDATHLPASTLDRVEVIHGSHGDIDAVNKAFAGADTVFWLVPPDPQAKSVEAAYVDFTRPACKAFSSQGVKRVIDIAPLGRGTPFALQAGFVTASLGHLLRFRLVRKSPGRSHPH